MKDPDLLPKWNDVITESLINCPEKLKQKNYSYFRMSNFYSEERNIVTFDKCFNKKNLFRYLFDYSKAIYIVIEEDEKLLDYIN